jgi:indole-3-glycerol phosphate synthase
MILDEICAYKRGEVEARKAARSLATVRDGIDDAYQPRGFREALRQPGISLIAEVKRASPVKGTFLEDIREALRQPGISLIAEVKRASPVKGTFLEDINPLELASVYEENGARVVSVLTDEKYFKGSLDDLTMVRKGVGIPCLRKEFIVDEYQIYESREANADAILLIVRVLSDEQLRDYIELATKLHMDVLVETHTAEEIDRALAAGARIVGVNNRDLSSFTVDINTTLELKKLVPGGVVLVSESGIHTTDDVQKLQDSGIDAILVGEALVSSPDIAAKVRELLAVD